MSTLVTESQKAGDGTWSLAIRYAASLGSTELAQRFNERDLDQTRYRNFIASMYPLVVGFNRGLILSLSKVDHVRDSRFVRTLAEQIQEEQEHNALWRGMLKAFGIDHDKLYTTYEAYMGGFTEQEKDRLCMDVAKAILDDPTNVHPGIFKDAPFPEPVVALCHHLVMTATSPEYDHWEHFACQGGIEFIILNLVSNYLHDCVVGNPELDLGPQTVEWWKEHASQSSADGKRSDEEKHLEMTRRALNRNRKATELKDRILATSEQAMALFVAAIRVHDEGRSGFDANRYPLTQAAVNATRVTS